VPQVHRRLVEPYSLAGSPLETGRLRGCLNWSGHKPLDFSDQVRDRLVALADVIDGALVNDAAYLVGRRRKRLSARKDVSKDLADRVDLVHYPVVPEAAKRGIADGPFVSVWVRVNWLDWSFTRPKSDSFTSTAPESNTFSGMFWRLMSR